MQPLPDKSNWDETYRQDPETKLIINHLPINAPFDQATVLNLRSEYRTTIDRNQI